MKGNDSNFRIHLRLNRVEYADLIADIESHKGYAQTARIRMLLRRGLLADTGAMPKVADTSGNARAPVPAVQSTAESRAPVTISTTNVLDRFNLDPTAFSFGSSK